MRTQVGIVGGGPAGTLLSHLLHLRGIESVVLELRGREEVETTVRAGVLEDATAGLLARRAWGRGWTGRGRSTRGSSFASAVAVTGSTWPILRGRASSCTASRRSSRTSTRPASKRADGSCSRRRPQACGTSTPRGPRIRFRGGARLDPEAGEIRFRDEAPEDELVCDYVVGADGFFGPSRRFVPEGVRREHARAYPFGWFGILVEGPPATEELIYCLHERGFALVSTRSPEIQRLYFQCDPNDSVDNWSDDRIWSEMHARLDTEDGWTLTEGRIFQKASCRCEASSASRCATDAYSSPATRPTSSPRPALRA
jgi:p-hydroxybenzoate 3-monooxygenase